MNSLLVLSVLWAVATALAFAIGEEDGFKRGVRHARDVYDCW